MKRRDLLKAAGAMLAGLFGAGSARAATRVPTAGFEPSVIADAVVTSAFAARAGDRHGAGRFRFVEDATGGQVSLSPWDHEGSNPFGAAISSGTAIVVGRFGSTWRLLGTGWWTGERLPVRFVSYGGGPLDQWEDADGRGREGRRGDAGPSHP